MPDPATGAPLPLRLTYQDDPRVVAESVTEDYARHVVPLTQRVGRWNVASAMWAVFSALAYVYTGGALMNSVGSVNTIVGMVLAAVVFGVVNYVMSTLGIRRGLTVALLSRKLFGSVGALITTLIFAVTATFFAAFEGSIIATGLQTYFAPHSDIRIWYAVSVLYALPLVIGGVQAWLGKLNGVLLPLYVVGLIVAVVAAGSKSGFSSDFLTAHGSMHTSVPGWLWVLGIYCGFSVNMMFTVDYARFGKASDTRFHGVLSFGLLFYLAAFVVDGVVGMFLISTISGTDASGRGLTNALIGAMGIFGLLFIIVSQTRINTANYYLGSTNFEAFMGRVFRLRWPRLVWVVILGVIVFVVMLSDIFTYLLTALSWLAVLATSWLGVMLCHLAMNRGASSDWEFRSGRVHKVNTGTWVLIAMTALGICILQFGSASAWYVETVPLWIGPLAALVYLVWSRAAAAHPVVRTMDPRDEVEDVWGTWIECHVCEHSYVAVEMDRDPSADQQAICAACADASRTFLRAVQDES